jgi:hypothetical protein
MDSHSRRTPSELDRVARWWAGFIRKSSGTSNTSATSKALGASVCPGCTSATTGVMMNWEPVGRSAGAHHLDEARVQAHFLLRLAQRGVRGVPASVGSALPPGKAICPECVDKCAVRSVSSTVGRSRMHDGHQHRGMGRGLRSANLRSGQNSGSHCGGRTKRWRIAPGRASRGHGRQMHVDAVTGPCADRSWAAATAAYRQGRGQWAWPCARETKSRHEHCWRRLRARRGCLLQAAAAFFGSFSLMRADLPLRSRR